MKKFNTARFGPAEDPADPINKEMWDTQNILFQREIAWLNRNYYDIEGDLAKIRARLAKLEHQADTHQPVYQFHSYVATLSKNIHYLQNTVNAGSSFYKDNVRNLNYHTPLLAGKQSYHWRFRARLYFSYIHDVPGIFEVGLQYTNGTSKGTDSLYQLRLSPSYIGKSYITLDFNGTYETTFDYITNPVALYLVTRDADQFAITNILKGTINFQMWV